ncbi:MAG: protein tyrosine phosphatase family protein [Xanthomonadales bacterium]|nr:protein tyrosine phosphatase family protein [Xanthomonadales bacterium]
MQVHKLEFVALFLLTSVFLSSIAVADQLKNIDNYLEYSPIFSSSGQPNKQQLSLLSENKFKRIIYLAFSDQSTSLAKEDRIVKSLNMDFVHIPVDFEKPTLNDFNMFAAVMKTNPGAKTLLHCQINLRASTFSFLYRVIHKQVPMKTAKDDLDKIWEPNPVWFKFIKTVLDSHGLNPECDDCDWGSNTFSD